MNQTLAILSVAVLGIVGAYTYYEVDINQGYNDFYLSWAQEVEDVSVAEDFTVRGHRLVDDSRERPTIATIETGRLFGMEFVLTPVEISRQVVNAEMQITGPDPSDTPVSQALTTESKTIRLLSKALRPGQYDVTLRMFDNLIDRNEIKTAVTLPITVTGIVRLTDEEQTAVITDLQVQLNALEARIVTLEAFHPRAQVDGSSSTNVITSSDSTVG